MTAHPRAGRGQDGGDLPPDVQIEHWLSASLGAVSGALVALFVLLGGMG
jgi:hypothetical protein